MQLANQSLNSLAPKISSKRLTSKSLDPKLQYKIGAKKSSNKNCHQKPALKTRK